VTERWRHVLFGLRRVKPILQLHGGGGVSSSLIPSGLNPGLPARLEAIFFALWLLLLALLLGGFSLATLVLVDDIIFGFKE